MRRALAALHRWLGAALCVMFAIWFASGIVMVFAGFPSLDDARRLAALPALALDETLATPAAALAHTRAGGRVRLGMLAGRPVYRFVDGDPSAGVVDAATGRDATVDAETISPLVDSFAAHVGASWATALVETRDQWNVTSPGIARFPLLRFAAADAARTEVYVSLKTAEVVQVTSRRDRITAWFGAIPHWIYPIALRRHAAAWRWLVIALATLGAIGSLAGLLLGIWSLRPCWISPYRKRWMRWHHTLGLFFGIFAFTWVGSGAWSLEPFRAGGRAPARGTGSDAALRLDQFTVAPTRALALCRREITPREIELVRIDGRPFYLCRQSPEAARLVAADRTSTGTTPASPAFARSGESALDRWLFRGLHCLDFPFLPSRSCAWYLVTLALCAGGLIFSVTGVAVAAAWMSRTCRRLAAARRTSWRRP